MWADGSNNVITCCRCYHKRYVSFIYFNQASIYKNKIAISYKFLFIRLATDKCRYLFFSLPFSFFSSPPSSLLFFIYIPFSSLYLSLSLSLLSRRGKRIKSQEPAGAMQRVYPRTSSCICKMHVSVHSSISSSGPKPFCPTLQ